MTIHCSVVSTDESAWDFGTPRFGKICFVDLAGSERLKVRPASGLRGVATSSYVLPHTTRGVHWSCLPPSHDSGLQERGRDAQGDDEHQQVAIRPGQGAWLGVHACTAAPPCLQGEELTPPPVRVYASSAGHQRAGRARHGGREQRAHPLPRLQADQAAHGLAGRQRAGAHDCVLQVRPIGSAALWRSAGWGVRGSGQCVCAVGICTCLCVQPEHEPRGGDAEHAELRHARQEHPEPAHCTVRPQGGTDHGAAARD